MTSGNRLALAAGVLVPLLGLALHVHIASKAAGGWSGFTLGLLLWSALPYVLCMLAAAVAKRPVHAAVGAAFCLVLDILTYRSVFVSPTSSTAALGLVFTPLANLLVAAPVGYIATALVLRLRGSKARQVPS